MRRWITFAAALYPRSWRAEYGKEFDALLEELKPGWRVFTNTLAGGIRMHMTTGTKWLRLAVTTGVIGAIVGWGVSFVVDQHYVSSAIVSVTPQADPLRPTSPQALHERAAANAAAMEAEILSRTSLDNIVLKLDLYKRERQRIPLLDVLARMRSNIAIQSRPFGGDGLDPIVFTISFDYPDPAFAQAAVRDLAAKFAYSNAVSTRNRKNIYRTFWQDEATEAAIHHSKLVPPPPPLEAAVSIAGAPSLPVRTRPDRIAFAAWGLGAGALLGLLAAVAMFRPRGGFRLAGFATAGVVIACALSFAIPVRYTSTAVMIVSPAVLTVDPLATPSPATPAGEFLRQMEPEALSIQKLSTIIQRLDLYGRERATRPIEDVARMMLASDLRVSSLTPASGVDAPASAFRISFSYRDRAKAQWAVQMVITALQDEHLMRVRADAMQGSDRLREITQRKAGENLDVLDPPSLPTSAESPNRSVIGAVGLGIGLLLAAITLVLPRRRKPVLRARRQTNDGPAEQERPGQSCFIIDFSLDDVHYTS